MWVDQIALWMMGKPTAAVQESREKAVVWVWTCKSGKESNGESEEKIKKEIELEKLEMTEDICSGGK